MTIQEELEIYQRMLKAFRKQYWRPFKYKFYGFSGFCSYISTKMWRQFDWPKYCTGIENLSILYSLKPTDLYEMHPGGYWFKPYKMSPRIKLLKKAIKICKQQLKSEKYVGSI